MFAEDHKHYTDALRLTAQGQDGNRLLMRNYTMRCAYGIMFAEDHKHYTDAQRLTAQGQGGNRLLMRDYTMRYTYGIIFRHKN